ncbi:hypothetical protein ACFQZT_29800 [Paenibacillus sp. GCM10027628]|uniref:hypothetical protein n=1 Tax=Paenibacillus sp. GCM10027628 TaxID=3273413 RepID=UPI00362D09EC
MNSFRRTLSTVTKPFSFVHKTLVGLGFDKTKDKHVSMYKLAFVSPETDRSYTLYVTAHTMENGQAEVKLSEASFDEKHVPYQVKEAAISKLRDVADYLEQHSRTLKLVEDTHNSMAPTEDEMIVLGKQMKHMKTGSELLEEGLVPDPIQ